MVELTIRSQYASISLSSSVGSASVSRFERHEFETGSPRSFSISREYSHCGVYESEMCLGCVDSCDVTF